MVVGLKKAATLLTLRLFTPSAPALLPLGVTFLFLWVCVMLALPCLCMCFVPAGPAHAVPLMLSSCQRRFVVSPSSYGLGFTSI